MPKNWKTYKLSEVTTKIGSGATPRGGKEAYKKFGTSLIRSQNVLDFKFSTNGLAFIDEKQASKLDNVTIEENDVLLNITGDSVARVCSVPKEFLPARVNQHVAIVRADILKLDAIYLKYFLLENTNKNMLLTLASAGATRNALTKIMIEDFRLDLPPLPEQTQIANILSAIDDKIENNLAINKTLEDMAMALYKHWFVDFGPFREGEFIDSELGLIPKGWEVKSVKDFGETITGKTPSKKFPEHFGKDMPFVTPTDFKNYGKHILNANRSISKLGIEKHKRNVIPANSIIVTCIGSDMGKVAISKTSCLTNQQINSLKCKNYHFMFCFFVHNYSLLKSLAGDGTTMPIINKSTFESIEVLYPGNENLNSFEKIIKEYDKQILNNTQENQSLTNLRDNLLPKLISGEVRLKEFREGIDAEMNSA
jgi:type I restriction enzyme S subunit